jgi:hypothetical protein
MAYEYAMMALLVSNSLRECVIMCYEEIQEGVS